MAARTQQARGAVWETLLDATDEVDAAVIVTGVHGRGVPTSAILGSVSRELIAHSYRPVPVVPSAQYPAPRHRPPRLIPGVFYATHSRRRYR
ncbi:universal stress protein [Streptomyces sp. NPDC017202]|uniref:universal stress protein n=1 Tax=Streptomyces sp. NPDC017202 TaxID=3364981 RepID=UPI0037A53213